MKISLPASCATLILGMATALGSQPAPAATQPATAPQTQAARKDPVRKFTTMIAALADAPADIRPKASPDWYKFTEGKFLQWARQKFVGMTIDESMAYWGGPTTSNIYKVPGKEFMTWSGAFGDKTFTDFGAQHRWTIRYPAMFFDEAGARKWDRIKKGTLFKVKGVIDSVTVSPSKGWNRPGTLPAYLFTFHLKDIEITPP